MKWFRRRHAAQDERVAEARAGAEAAGQEVELSLRRAEVIRRRVNEPRRMKADGNQFADMIRATLANGHREGA